VTLKPEEIELAVLEFKARAASELDFCEELFRHATIRLLAHKWAYYTQGGRDFVKDIAYDGEEQSWFIMGRALGHLAEDETSPCIDFDPKHPLASDAIAYAKTLKFRPPE
jgi:hypothetical protein